MPKITKTKVKPTTALIVVTVIVCAAAVAVAVGVGIFGGGGLPAVIVAGCSDSGETFSRDVPSRFAEFNVNPLYFNPYVKSTAKQVLSGGVSHTDSCAIFVYSSATKTWNETKVASCSQADEDGTTKRKCHIQEAYCTGKYPSYYDLFVCPNGCLNGACLESASKPDAYYKFNDNTLDSSGNGANATAFGSPTFALGKISQALQFDGVNDYVALPINYLGNYHQINQLTACTWFYAESISNDAYGNWSFVDFDRSEYFNFFINEKTGQLGFSTHSKSPALIHDLYSERRYLYDSDWHFGCAIYDFGKKYFYLDGKLDYGEGNTAAQTFHSGAPLESALTRFGFIGDGSKAASFNGAEETNASSTVTGRSNSYYSGLIDELRIYEKVLTEAELKNLYLAGFGLDCDPKYQTMGIDPENLTYAQKQLLAEFAISKLSVLEINFMKGLGLDPNNLSICDKIYFIREAEIFASILQSNE